MATYLVTGGCGFIGSHLCRTLLSGGHHPRILDDLSTGSLSNLPAGVEFIRGNITDERTVDAAMEGVRGCFHLAALASVEHSIQNWLGAHRTNLSGTIAVFEAARKLGRNKRIPVVYASSAAVYGGCQQLPLQERTPAQPCSPYGADKYACEVHARIATDIHRIPTIGLRFFNVYGPRQDPRSPYSGVISIFCDRLLRREPIEVFGNGRQTRDFVFVADVVGSVIRAMQQAEASVTPIYAVYNVCSGAATSVVDLARVLGEICGCEPEIEFRPARSGEIVHSFGDRSLITRELGLAAPTDLRSGLASTVLWMQTPREDESAATSAFLPGPASCSGEPNAHS